ncbi:MAG TPA: patatin family protein [Dehalococcoidia bacterium]|nr:patatin family protein [Dehalococcoidia bacterium]
MRNRKIGLALGSGAARGLAHIGVLEVLEKEGITIDMLAGSSAGALVGALYAQGKDISQIKNLVIDLGSKRFAFLADPALPKTGLIKGRRIKEVLKSIIGGDIGFSNLRIPLACVATDIVTGEEVVINQGSVLEGVRASISIPVIFAVVKWKGRYLVDGGLVNPVPASVLRDMGADFIIAVNVAPSISGKLHQVGREPNIFNVIMQTIHIAAYQSLKLSLSEADVVIEPQVASIGYFDFHRTQECILQGELAAQESIIKIKRQLEA